MLKVVAPTKARQSKFFSRNFRDHSRISSNSFANESQNQEKSSRKSSKISLEAQIWTVHVSLNVVIYVAHRIETNEFFDIFNANREFSTYLQRNWSKIRE